MAFFINMKHWTVEEERALLSIVQERNLLSAIDGKRARNAQVSIVQDIFSYGNFSHNVFN